MKPLLILLAVFALCALVLKLTGGAWSIAFAARIALCCMLLFTAIGHFVYTKGMALMLPGFLPFKQGIVYITGIMEVLFAVGLLIPEYQVLTAWLLIAFLILMLPANIYAAVKQVDYQKATYEGNGVRYLWFRVPLQVLFIIWTYGCAI